MIDEPVDQPLDAAHEPVVPNPAVELVDEVTQALPTPGGTHFGPAVARFDAAVDRWLEQVRGNPVADAVFSGASHAGDHSVVWHVVNVARGVAVRRPDQVVALALALGTESLVVNQGLKRIFRRERPTTDGDGRTPVRRPNTSSFPSGHASSAAFNATILTAWDRDRAALWWGVAAVVAASRPYVRIHHASDVVGGLVVGVGMGLVAVRVMRRLGMP